MKTTWHDVYYDSLDKYWESIEKPVTDNNILQSVKNRRDFSDCTFDESKELAIEGYPTAIKSMERISSEIKKEVFSQGIVNEIVPHYDVVGECPDVGAFLSGEPEHMLSFVEDKTMSNRVIKIVNNVNCSGSIPFSAIMARGTFVLALVDALEMVGIRCEVESCWYGSNRSYGEPDFSARILVKKSDESLNLQRMSYVLGHPGFFRRHMFRTFEQMPKDIVTRHAGGYGFLTEAPKDRQGDYYLPMMISYDKCWNDPKSCAIKIKEIIKNLGVTLTEVI